MLRIGLKFMVRKIVTKVPPEILQKDLEKYRRMTLELGATDAKILPSSQVIIDERVRLKCICPKCRWYGTNANCPPHAVDLDTIRKIVKTSMPAPSIEDRDFK